MRSPARSARPRLGWPLLLAALLATACGPDLSRQNFPRTTVTAAAAADSPITDEAASFANLRTVDPCGLLDSRTLSELGTVKAGSQDASSLTECSADVADAGGKDLSLNLQLDDITLKTRDASGTVGSLPLLEDGPDGSLCTVTAVTSRSPGYGISLRVTYDGGDPCNAGQTGLQGILRRLHDNPARLPQPPSTLLTVDFCAVTDENVITDALGRGSTGQVYGLHGCTWSGGSATGYLDYGIKPAPDANGATPVDLGDGVTGYQRLETGSGRRCFVNWLHLPMGNGSGEVVSVQYDNYHDDAANDDACGKAAAIARSVIPKLPHA
ncbi:DUF3558 domain-containing protein [Amycolatopsis alkalitolerans]|uniref:DUF3558 domain-containing protein n=1 Tax=Amycolatopsis alkalitolerans TaxID=2547244 RepID=A0A5C4LSX5_9PSEU|nr:DUF3558 domain-containing protein [Amycolatopsis alkalitolerans]TNC22126.1 DUF3558 domain-containing protein [Amycolatopsis alkalitolerans]